MVLLMRRVPYRHMFACSQIVDIPLYSLHCIPPIVNENHKTFTYIMNASSDTHYLDTMRTDGRWKQDICTDYEWKSRYALLYLTMTSHKRVTLSNNPGSESDSFPSTTQDALHSTTATVKPHLYERQGSVEFIRV